MRFYALHLPTGGIDYACADCLPEARRDLRPQGTVSVAEVPASAADRCSWCYAEREAVAS